MPQALQTPETFRQIPEVRGPLRIRGGDIEERMHLVHHVRVLQVELGTESLKPERILKGRRRGHLLRPGRADYGHQRLHRVAPRTPVRAALT